MHLLLNPYILLLPLAGVSPDFSSEHTNSHSSPEFHKPRSFIQHLKVAVEMVQFSTLFNGFAKNISTKSGRKDKINDGKLAADTLAKESRKNDLMLSSRGSLSANGYLNTVSVFSKKGQKGINQDRFVVLEEFGCQEDMSFCGIFDGHGPWGHLVSKRVRKLMPSSLLCNWQETVALDSVDLSSEMNLDKSLHQYDIWKKSILKTCSAVDQDLKRHHDIDSSQSGTTALTIVRQGDLIVIANIGDCRAVLATISDDDNLVPVQLTVDLKPNLPQETERITLSKGRVLSLDDEPGVYRIWIPDGNKVRGPGLAVSRAFGDHDLKGYGLISEPVVTQRRINCRDQFVILATDGVWDVISNKEAVEIVSSAPRREESAKRLVQHAVRAWKRKKSGIAMDDISAICLYFHTSPISPSPEKPVKLP